MSATATSTTTYTERRTTARSTNITLDIGFVKSVSGWIKMAEILFSLLTLIMAANCYEHQWFRGWTLFVSITAFFLTIGLFLILLFCIPAKFSQLPWKCIEAVFNATYCVMYFVAMICMCMLAWRFRRYNLGSPIAGAIFAFICFCLYGCDFYIRFRQWRHGNMTSTRHVTSSGGQTTTTTTTTVVRQSGGSAYP